MVCFGCYANETLQDNVIQTKVNYNTEMSKNTKYKAGTYQGFDTP